MPWLCLTAPGEGGGEGGGATLDCIREAVLCVACWDRITRRGVVVQGGSGGSGFILSNDETLTNIYNIHMY